MVVVEYRGVVGLNESPSEKEGKYHPTVGVVTRRLGLNESPSEKEGKSTPQGELVTGVYAPQ